VTTQAFVGNAFLYRGDGGSPEVMTRVCQAFGLSGIGKTNEQVDATTFCSGGIKEYVAGLADGSEVTMELNLETILPGAQVILDMIDDVNHKRTRDFELRFDGNNDGTDTDLVFHFTITCLSWTVNPSPTAKNTVTFTGKITGDINITTG
jgi:hypothetical protein